MGTAEKPETPGARREPARDVLLVGSVPMTPASAVFETVGAELGPLLRRVSDGDQNGWILATAESFLDNPALEVSRQVELSTGGITVTMVRLREGVNPGDLVLGPYGYAEEAARSYRTFLEMRERGVFAADSRLQVTMPGPGTSSYFIELPSEVLLPLAREALAREVQNILGEVPAADLTIQFDVAMEAEHEEWRRRPEDFDTPIHEAFDWTLEEMASSVGWLADQVPEEVELGFHVCTVWHHDREAGQDNETVVDEINAVVSRVHRRVDYLHMPTIPEHTEKDFAALGRLELKPETQFYLGVIHAEDGRAGAERRIREAEAHRPGFGIASFCGLGIPAIAAADSNRSSLVALLELHRDLAEGLS